MPRPWYRSRLFWLLIPGCCFLVWAWGDSGRYSTGVRMMPGERQILLRQRGGEMTVFWRWSDNPYSYAHPGQDRFRIEREPPPPEVLPEKSFAGLFLPEDAVFHRLDVSHGAGYTHRSRIVAVAHWLVVLGYVLLSAGTIVLRQHRKQRRAGEPRATTADRAHQ